MGGKFKMTVLDFSTGANTALTSEDIVFVYADEDMGGYADLPGSVLFTDPTNDEGVGGGSSSGCDTGLGFLSLGLMMMFVMKSRKN